MDNIKDGRSVNRPLVLNDTNYDYWKGKMVASFKSMDNKTWKVVIKGWKHLMTTSEDRTSILKLETDWTNSKDDESLGNSKVLNAIFNSMDKNMFRLINTYTGAKEA